MNATDLAWIIAPSAIFGVGVIDDLRYRKFHNWLFITCAVCAFFVAIVSGGFAALGPAALGFAAGVIFCLPLVLSRALGAGDMKLLAAVGILIGWYAVLQVLLFAILWGALFGVLKALFGGKLPEMARNLARIVTLQSLRNRSLKSEQHEVLQPMELTQIPFTVALLLGWLSQLMLQGKL